MFRRLHLKLASGQAIDRFMAKHQIFSFFAMVVGGPLAAEAAAIAAIAAIMLPISMFCGWL